MLLDSVVQDIFGLTPAQARAAATRGKDLIVTAGAGSGKTRTLVARYITLLVDGHLPRQLVAVTFTEKAAREMRNRVRQTLDDLRTNPALGTSQAFWDDLQAQMDAARIGTIHSLCAEILRTNPAEAGVDPEFEVLDEGLTAALRARVVEDSLAWAFDREDMRPLFDLYEVRTLERLVHFSLDQRLDVMEWISGTQTAGHSNSNLGDESGYALIRKFLQEFDERPEITAILDQFRQMQADESLLSDAGEKLAPQIEALLVGWSQFESVLQQGNLLQALTILYDLRKNHMGLQAGSRSSICKQELKELRGLYDLDIYKWLREPPDSSVEAAYQSMMPLVRLLFMHSHQVYRDRLVERSALDFDDLESYALQLLRNADIRRYWQAEIRALLVDEFQDTNQRQREIVELLAGQEPGRLFAVGDDRQSIYRFRGADVTVFRQMQNRIRARGGEAIEIGRTFRAHSALLDGLGGLLEPLMAPDKEPPPAYWVPFSPLEAYRREPRQGTAVAYLEIVLGSGEDAGSGRAAAAAALAQRLLTLKAESQIQHWGDVALLFRASTAFPAYETALEKAGVPYVTVSGRGFYNRPEIRDVLNILRALADPWDDLALAGLLRSPAFGVTDASIYKLRWANGPGKPQSLYRALDGDLSDLNEAERARIRRAASFLFDLAPLADRLPVAELLKRVIDRSDYRTILAAGLDSGTSDQSRLWRNLDKLLVDAHASRLVNVRAFLEYLQTLRDVGAREGEAPPDVLQGPDSGGAVQLMTVHKSKGLEFNLVVVADAAYNPGAWSEVAYLDPVAGLGIRMDRMEGIPILYSFARYLDAARSEAEEKRLLYVAATRAREKLIISGHLSRDRARGWLKEIAAAAGIDLKAATQAEGNWESVTMPCGQVIAVCSSPTQGQPEGSPPQPVEEETQPDAHLGQGAELFFPLDVSKVAEPDPERLKRVTGRRHAPSVVVGKLVHQAIQRWRFPSDPGLDALLKGAAYQAGLVDGDQISAAIREAKKLLNRLQKHALWYEIDQASERHHEVPYSLPANGKIETGYIDLLYRDHTGWHLVDFKTDELRDESALFAAMNLYRPQLWRYARAFRELLGSLDSSRICFLDYRGEVYLV